MGTTASTSRSGFKEVAPSWIYTVAIPPHCLGDKVGGASDGIMLTGPYTVTRFRKGHFDSDGARWSRGFTSGKHTFEIYFPEVSRGMEATVGVGTESAALYAKGKVALVGMNIHSWGISLRTKRAFHRNTLVKKYPQTQVPLPDKFYMYLDADAGVLQFGSDLDYYGAAFNNIPCSKPLYPMVSATKHGATISIIYRGMGNTEQLVPMVGPQVVMLSSTPHQQQQQQQQSVAVVAAPAANVTVISTATPAPAAVELAPPPPVYTPVAVEPSPSEEEKPVKE